MRTSSKEIVKFLQMNCPNPTHAVTLTAVQESPLHKTKINRVRLEKSIKWAIKRINTACFNRNQRRKGYSIGVVVTIEGWRAGENLHSHLALSAPSGMEFNEFTSVIESVTKKCNWLDRQKDIQPFVDSGWLDYMVKLGPEALAPHCFYRAFP
jgi:hypothetical protein